MIYYQCLCLLFPFKYTGRGGGGGGGEDCLEVHGIGHYIISSN